MRRSIFALISIIAALFIAPQTHAQNRSECGSITNPLEALVGTWTFSSKTFAASRIHLKEFGKNQGEAQPFVAAGRFTASIGDDGGGVLSITQTSNDNGQIRSQKALIGTYEVFSDCSGGTLTFSHQAPVAALTFNPHTPPIRFDFWFADTGSLITAISTTPGFVLWTDVVRSNQQCVNDCFVIDDACPLDDAGCARQFNRCINNCRCFPRCGSIFR